MMHLKLLWAGGLCMTAAMVAGSFAAEPAAAPTFDLFTAAEAAAWTSTQSKAPSDFSTRDLRDESGAPTCRSTPNNDADNPQIRILAPPLGKAITSPLDIDLQFIPAGSTPIRPETFRICYVGLSAMDITKRVTDRIPVSQKGLHVSGAQLPQGHHRLLMLVADERGRLARREAVFDIY
jgi:hypothetical protein